MLDLTKGKTLFLLTGIMNKEIPEDSVFIETTIHASVEKVWGAWTEPAVIMKWFGSDPKGEVLSAKMDVRPGGSFEVTFKDSDQTEHTCYGIYNEIEKPGKLTFTWHWKSEPNAESFIVVLLIEEGRSTKMQFEHLNFGSGSKHNYVKGWQSTFSKLEQLLGGNLKIHS
jgi:uncharacterized protein YndB with AHSA1/START domain